MNVKVDVKGLFVDNTYIKQKLEEAFMPILKNLGSTMARNIAKASSGGGRGYTVPHYLSSPKPGKYLVGDGRTDLLSDALGDVEHQVSVSVDSLATIKIGSVSELDNATYASSMQGHGGYWRLFEGYGKYDKGERVGSSKTHYFRPVDSVDRHGKVVDSKYRGKLGKGIAKKIPAIQVGEFRFRPHPGVKPIQMFKLTKKAFRKEFMGECRKATKRFLAMIKEAQKGNL